MDKFDQLIESIVEKKTKDAPYLKTMPCTVEEVVDEYHVKVISVSSGTRYTVPNYSGSQVYVGETVQLFYKGNMALNSNAYIGASLNKGRDGEGYSPVCVKGSSLTGQVFEEQRTVSGIGILCEKFTAVALLVFNANVVGTEGGTLEITVYVDDEQYPFLSQTTLQPDYHSTVSFTLPINISAGKHKIKICASGTSEILDVLSYVYCDRITETDYYDPTDEGDYIFEIVNDESYAEYYIGESKNPAIPDTLDNKPVKLLGLTLFDHSDVETVYIPNGIEEIQ